MFSTVEEQLSSLNVSGRVKAHVLLCRWDIHLLGPFQAQPSSASLPFFEGICSAEMML